VKKKKMNTKRMVGIVAVAIAMLLVTTSVAPVTAQDISAVVEGIDNDMAELIEATEVIHIQTDAILGVGDSSSEFPCSRAHRGLYGKQYREA
jgi:hypothetical protein